MEASNDFESKSDLEKIKLFFNPVKSNLKTFMISISKENLEFPRKVNENETESLLDQFIDEKIVKEMKSSFIYLPFIYQAIHGPLIDLNGFVGKVLLKSCDSSYV